MHNFKPSRDLFDLLILLEAFTAKLPMLTGDNHPVLLAAVVVAAARSILRPPSLQTLLEDVP